MGGGNSPNESFPNAQRNDSIPRLGIEHLKVSVFKGTISGYNVFWCIC